MASSAPAPSKPKGWVSKKGKWDSEEKLDYGFKYALDPLRAAMKDRGERETEAVSMLLADIVTCFDDRSEAAFENPGEAIKDSVERASMLKACTSDPTAR